jgi:hypothetical protein
LRAYNLAWESSRTCGMRLQGHHGWPRCSRFNLLKSTWCRHEWKTHTNSYHSYSSLFFKSLQSRSVKHTRHLPLKGGIMKVFVCFLVFLGVSWCFLRPGACIMEGWQHIWGSGHHMAHPWLWASTSWAGKKGKQRCLTSLSTSGRSVWHETDQTDLHPRHKLVRQMLLQTCWCRT